MESGKAVAVNTDCMRLEDYWGIGPKTRDVLVETMGEEAAVEAIESADVSALADAGVQRGRATGIVRRARGGAGIEALATRDARQVYKDVLDRIASYAVTEGARDAVYVLTPHVEESAARDRLEGVLDAMATWEDLDDADRNAVLDVFEDHDEEAGRRRHVETALALREADVSGAPFDAVEAIDEAALEEALESLTYLEEDGVAPGADDELDRHREAVEETEEMMDSALDVVEELRESGARDPQSLQDEFLEYVVDRVDAPYEEITAAMPDQPEDVTDFVSQTLRTLHESVRHDYELRESEVRDTLETQVEENADAIAAAREAVDDVVLHVTLARFALDHGLNEPSFVDDGVAVEGARNLALLGDDAVDVQPVDYGLGDHGVDAAPAGDTVAVLTGANSGGKTTLLETVCQIVLLAQMGLPVPAERAEVEVVDAVVFHRRHASFNAGVLESTLRNVVPPLVDEGRTLMLVDEFEAITEPGSAADLLHGLVTLTVEETALGVFVTHLADDLEPLPSEGRIDGIFAEGLDEDLELMVDYQPRFGTVGRSTPEFIVSRLIARAGDALEKRGYEHLGEAVGIERIQQTLEEIE